MSTASLNFRVRSSSSDQVYSIEATFSPRLKITCTCKAGLNGAICKHRTALLLGETSSVVDLDMSNLLSLTVSEEASALYSAVKEMADLQEQADKLNTQLSTRKKLIARLLNGERPSNAVYSARY